MTKLYLRSRLICFLMAFLTIALSAGSIRSESETVSFFKKILLQSDKDKRYGLRVPSNDPRLKAIQCLSEIGSAEAVGVLQEFLTTYGANRKLKPHALVALGRIGTKTSIEAIGKFEAWAENVRAAPQDFRFGKSPYATDHFAFQDLKPLIKCSDNKGREWAIFWWRRFGVRSLWITEARGDGRWSKPVVLNLPDLPEVSKSTEFDLAVKGETFIFIVDDHMMQFSLKGQLFDSDGDGAADNVEQLLQTDPKNADTDNDGILDGKDGNPLTPKHKVSNDITEIRQAIFFILFAPLSSPDAVVIVEKGEFAEQEYCGHGGFVLKSPEIRHGFVNVTHLTVNIESPTTASATIRDWEGTSASSGHKAKLVKIHGKWVVVDFRMTWIS